MIHEKIKQRLLGLLGVCIILMAFVPALFEEPDTFLAIAPTLVPESPQISETITLFDSALPAGKALRNQVISERLAYTQALQAPGADQSALPDSTLPLSLPEESAIEHDPVKRTDTNAGFALPRAWTVKLMESSDRNRLVTIQHQLKQDRLPSYLINLPVGTASGGQLSESSEPALVLYGGPFLRLEDAQMLVQYFAHQYPEQSPALETYLPD